MIRVLLVDDQQLVRTGLRMLFDSAPDISVIGEAANGHDAVRLSAEHQPDVILMDLRMPVMDGTTATRKILERQPNVHIVVLTTFDDDDNLYSSLRAGASGFLAKDTAPADLLDAVRKAADGQAPFSPHVLKRLVTQAMSASPPQTSPQASPQTSPQASPRLPFTRREAEVMALLVEGLSNQDIAASLHLGVTTVKTHLANLMTKTGVNNRVQLAVLAARSGIGQP